MKKEDFFWKTAIGLAILAFGVGIAGYMFAGLTSRMMQDDYCYDVILGNRGFIEGQVHSYLQEDTYSGNRFSLNLTMGLSETLGRWTIPVLPAFLIALWVAGLYIFQPCLARLGYLSMNKAESLLCALAVASFTMGMAPNWQQVLYWRNGMLTYFAPTVSLTWLAVMVLFYDGQRRWPGIYLMGVFFLALLAGGFS